MPDTFSSTRVITAGDGLFNFHLVGEANFQQVLSELPSTGEFPVILQCEESTIPDHTAIAAYSSSGDRIGYFPHEDADRHCDDLDDLQHLGPVVCAGRLIGGTPDRPSFGVVTDFADHGWQRSAGHMDGPSRRFPYAERDGAADAVVDEG